MATLPSSAGTPAKAHRDNLLGVCAALGEVSGIDPLVFRIGFVLAMLGASFDMALIAYCIAGVAVAIARR